MCKAVVYLWRPKELVFTEILFENEFVFFSFFLWTPRGVHLQDVYVVLQAVLWKKNKSVPFSHFWENMKKKQFLI